MAGTLYNPEIPEMEITIREDGEVYKRNLKEDITIDDPNKINEYLVQNPGKTAFWTMRWQKVKVAVQRAKVQVEVYEAELGKRFREIAKEKAVKLTEKELEHLIRLDETYQKLYQGYLNLQEDEGVLKAAVDAMHDLRDALRSLSNNYRAEYHSGITLKDKYESEVKAKRREVQAVTDEEPESHEPIDSGAMAVLRKRFK